ncbi:amine dehydrogenase large subunit [Taklimakanibacter deserti]|uniref:amine dehydrogenase large subunit n=1 Tax=Taklimakanibacter deserti TaxID=2267839 RepID=UPI0034D47BAB
MLRTGFFACAFVALLPFIAEAQEPLQPEQMTVEPIPAGTPKLFVADLAIEHIVDGRVRVYDANSMKLLGMVGTGFLGQVYIPPKQDVFYISTSYIEKITRGKRSDWLEIYDSNTLQFKGDIPIATTRAQALNYRPLLQGSSDDRWIFVQNATPATSISVVDLKAQKQTAELPNAGCYGIYPTTGNGLRFATMCGDGTFGTYTLKEDGSAAERKASEPIFDGDADALFIHGERDGNNRIFMSFPGNIYVVDLEGDTAKLVEKIEMTKGVEGDWRPGGYQTHAFHPKSGVLFVLMHKGGAEGSHKNPAEEIWAYDLRNKKLLSRSPTTTATCVTVGQGDEPAVYVIDAIGVKVMRYTSDATKGYALTAAGEQKAGNAPGQVESQ